MKCKSCGKETNVICICGKCPECNGINDRHPNIDEIIKVLKHLKDNGQSDVSVGTIFQIYHDWNKKCIGEINLKNQFKNSLEDIKAGRINKK